MSDIHLTLQRTIQGEEQPTFGTITDDSTAVVVPWTLELPDKGNQPMVSRIPAGCYPFTKRDSPHIGYVVWETQSVPNRSGIALHVLNTMMDSDGCVGVGLEKGFLYGLPAILGSQVAFDRLMAYCEGFDTLWLTVVDVPVV